PTPEEIAEIVRIARSANPKVGVFVRSHYLRDEPALREAGATKVFSGEGEVALAMTEHILTALGATPEQMDRERRRVREEVFLQEDQSNADSRDITNASTSTYFSRHNQRKGAKRRTMHERGNEDQGG